MRRYTFVLVLVALLSPVSAFAGSPMTLAEINQVTPRPSFSHLMLADVEYAGIRTEVLGVYAWHKTCSAVMITGHAVKVAAVVTAHVVKVAAVETGHVVKVAAVVTVHAVKVAAVATGHATKYVVVKTGHYTAVAAKAVGHSAVATWRWIRSW